MDYWKIKESTGARKQWSSVRRIEFRYEAFQKTLFTDMGLSIGTSRFHGKVYSSNVSRVCKYISSLGNKSCQLSLSKVFANVVSLQDILKQHFEVYKDQDHRITADVIVSNFYIKKLQSFFLFFYFF